MKYFAYQEQPASVLRPRHPVVSGLDIVGIVITLFFLTHSTHWAVQGYLYSVLLLYIFSALHHWMPHSDWRQKADHVMIFVMIAMTALPYWTTFMAFSWRPFGLIVICGIITIGLLVKMRSCLAPAMSGVLFTLAALPIICDMTLSWRVVPSPWNTVWMLGIALYGFQLVVYTYKMFDIRKDLFGFREVQHIALLGATTLHGLTALTLVG